MILTYHEISSKPSRFRYSIERELLDAHFEVVAQFQSAGGAALPDMVTFDDGKQSNYAEGLDLLRKHSVSATFFVIAGRMGAADGFMTWPELRELVSSGHRVQSHGWMHRPLPECSEGELRDELDRSKRVLEDRLGVPVDYISVPFGRWDDRVLNACAKTGYQRVYISNPWFPLQQRCGIELRGRYMVQGSMKAAQLRRLLAGDPKYLFFLSSRYRAQQILRSVIGHAAYSRVWKLAAGSEDVSAPTVSK